MIDLFRAMRPHQWTKNLLVFAGPMFSLQLLQPLALSRAAAAFVVFCVASSSVYLFNDLRDRDKDRLHPKKRHRPIAAGTLSPRLAVAVSVGLAIASMAGAAVLGPPAFAALIGGYLLMQIAYTLHLKEVAIVDALVVSAGFVMRAVAGALVIGVEISTWLLICTIFFALFVSLAKRRHELARLQEDGARHRPSLEGFDVALLDQLVAVATAASLMSYALYTTDERTVTRFHTNLLPLTIPFVVYAFFRFLHLTRTRADISDPTRAVLRDRGLGVAVLLWAISVVVILYAR